MIEDGSRFLVREGDKKHGVWVEVALEKARDKVAHDFRNLRRNAKIAKENATVAVAAAANSNNNENAKRRRSLKANIGVEGENDYLYKQARKPL